VGECAQLCIYLCSSPTHKYASASSPFPSFDRDLIFSDALYLPQTHSTQTLKHSETHTLALAKIAHSIHASTLKTRQKPPLDIHACAHAHTHIHTHARTVSPFPSELLGSSSRPSCPPLWVQTACRPALASGHWPWPFGLGHPCGFLG
jgi:hypothetical protein